MTTRHIELDIEGMTCEGCVNAITRAIHSHAHQNPLHQLRLKSVELESGKVALEVSDDLDIQHLIRQIEEQGYDVSGSHAVEV